MDEKPENFQQSTECFIDILLAYIICFQTNQKATIWGLCHTNVVLTKLYINFSSNNLAARHRDFYKVVTL